MPENTFVAVNQLNVADPGFGTAAEGAPDAGPLAGLGECGGVCATEDAAALSRLDAHGETDSTRYALGTCAPVSAPDPADRGGDANDSFLPGDAASPADGLSHFEVFVFVTWAFERFFGRWRLNDWGPSSYGSYGSRPSPTRHQPVWQAEPGDRPAEERARYNKKRPSRRKTLAEAFRAVAQMFDTLARLERSRAELSGRRHNRRHLSA